MNTNISEADNKDEDRRKASGLNTWLYGDFTPSKTKQRLYELAKQYHEETEAYDQTVCSGRTERGVAMPANAWQRRAINKNAMKVRERLLEENPGIERGELNAAISKYALVFDI